MLLAGLKAGRSFSETKSKCLENDSKLRVYEQPFYIILTPQFVLNKKNILILWILHGSEFESKQYDTLITSCIQSF